MEIAPKYINAGSIVTLCDEETLKESLSAGKGIKPIEYYIQKDLRKYNNEDYKNENEDEDEDENEDEE